jgi:hypothetical protein
VVAFFSVQHKELLPRLRQMKIHCGLLLLLVVGALIAAVSAGANFTHVSRKLSKARNNLAAGGGNGLFVFAGGDYSPKLEYDNIVLFKYFLRMAVA